MEAIETKIETGLQILDEREADLIALADQYKDLKINGVEDKEGYRTVREARIELKNARVGVENDAKSLRENAVKFQKAVIAREKELVLITLRTEKSLQDEEDKYKAALEAIRIQKEKEEKARIQSRINALSKFNYAIDLYDATTMSDDRFNELLTQVEIDYNAEQDRLAQEKAEAERLRKEEAERLKAEREELARQRADQEARERELQRQEAERIEAARKEREAAQHLALTLAQERVKLEEEKRQHQEAIRLEQAKKESAERAKIEEEQRIKRQEIDRLERERLAKLEAIRQEALKPDKEKLFQYARALMAIDVPELSHKDARKIIGAISERVVQTAEFIHDEAQAL